MNRRLLFAFLLALLLPFAQVAAAAHEVTHAKAQPASVQCDQCTLGAAVTGGAAVSVLPAIPLADAPQAAPLAPAPVARGGEPFTAFSSRAPPSQH